MSGLSSPVASGSSGAALGLPPGGALNRDTLLAYLRSQGLAETADQLLKETEKNVKPTGGLVVNPDSKDQSVGNVLSSYKSDGEPGIYDEVYDDITKFVDQSLDLYRHELALILYPVFVHMYLELVYNLHEEEAKAFIKKFGPMQESFFQADIQNLSYITKKQHMVASELMANFQTSQFTVRMSRDTYSQLRQQKKFMSERKHSILWGIIQEHLYLDVYEGIARSRKQVAATTGGVIGEASRQANKNKVFYGLLKEPDIQLANFLPPIDDEPDDPGAEKKKKKLKRDLIGLKKQKNDPNAPPASRMSFPELRDVDKSEKAKQLREAAKRQALGPDNLPSVCYYTVMNSGVSLSAVEISDDSSLLAVGFSNAQIKVFSLQQHRLRHLKSADELIDLDQESDDVMHRMMDDTRGETTKKLIGHSGPVYGLSLSPDRTLLLSCGEDGTVRMWSLQTWTCLVCYRGHILPVWQVKFSPQGFYFASSGHDRTVRLWSTEQSQCIRVFVGHFSDVDCVTFHPNCNYVASGSSDRSIRMWDCVTGNCVRLMTGHKAQVSCLCFSMDGRFLISGGMDNRVLIWDIAHGHLVGDFATHTSMITGVTFSRDGTLLTSVSNDKSCILWDFPKFLSELNLEELNVAHNPPVNVNASHYIVSNFRTKDSPIIGLHYTRRNLLLAVGAFVQASS